jgi:lysylphosphatidylglycerol synthetase-like protein (DUF2156 family)
MRDEQEKSEKAAKATSRMPLPGVAAISLYMLILSGLNILVVAHGQANPFFLIFSAAFIVASSGLMRSRRWAWALSLGAIVLLMGLFFWKASTQRDLYDTVQGLLNLVFFLYLIRTEVRERLV